MLSACFLAVFAIAMSDFAGAMRSKQQSHRAARAAAWAKERSDAQQWPSGSGV